MSTLIKRNGVHYLYWREAGKQHGKRISRDRAVALDYKSKFDSDLDRKKLNLPLKNVLWRDFCHEYMKYSLANKARRSIERDEAAVKSFNKNMPISYLSEFNGQRLEEYKALRRQQGVCNATINRELGTLRNMGRKAEEWNYTSLNPARNIKILPVNKGGRIRYLDKDEINKLVAASTGVWRTAILVGIYTGMRLGEVSHLTWDDVDLEKRTISVNPKKDWHPKDYDARTIPLHDKLFRHLQMLAKTAKTPLIMDYGNGKGITEQVFSAYVRKIFRRTGIKDASFHTLRHTFASHLVMSGVDLYAVSKLLGHATIKTTEIYAHLRPGFLKDSVSKLKY